VNRRTIGTRAYRMLTSLGRYYCAGPATVK
jgi:hypothetical protein